MSRAMIRPVIKRSGSVAFWRRSEAYWRNAYHRLRNEVDGVDCLARAMVLAFADAIDGAESHTGGAALRAG